MPNNRTEFDIPPVNAGTAKTATPIRSTMTPKLFINSFMVIEIYNYSFPTANKAIISRL